MSIPPINDDVFIAAFTGALGGISVGSGWITDTVAADYDNVILIAGAYADALDTAWNNAAPISSVEYDKIQCVSEALFTHRPAQPAANLQFQQAGNWTAVTAGVVALVNQADGYLNGQGIIPAPSGGNGTQRVRGVVTVPLPVALTAFPLADPGNDGITYALNDEILAIGETVGGTPIRSGPWVIYAINGPLGSLRRPTWWQNLAILKTSQIPIEVGSEGILFANTRFRAMGPQGGGRVTTPTDSFTVGIDDPGMYQEVYTLLVDAQQGGGLWEVFAPVLSTSTGVTVTDIFARPATTFQYAVTVFPESLPNGGLEIFALDNLGGVDTTNMNTLLVTIVNQSLVLPTP